MVKPGKIKIRACDDPSRKFAEDFCREIEWQKRPLQYRRVPIMEFNLHHSVCMMINPIVMDLVQFTCSSRARLW
jgi:hypothetical protein